MAQSLLKNIYLFEDFSDAELSLAEGVASKRSIDAGAEVFGQGSEASSLFVISYGTVNIRQDREGGEMLVKPLGTGSHFGEMSLIDGQKRSASAVTAERTEVLEIPYAGLEALFAEHPAMAAKFYRSLARFISGRLRETTNKLNFALGHHH